MNGFNYQIYIEEYHCAMKYLDDLKIPNIFNNQELSIVGRIKYTTNNFDFTK